MRRSLSWPPWKVLRLAVPRGKRRRSGVEALAMLLIDATGFLCPPGDAATLLGGKGEGGQSLNTRVFHCRPHWRSLVLLVSVDQREEAN